MGICMDTTWYRGSWSVISITTGSLTLLADVLDSMADALVSFIVWFGITMLHKSKSRLFHFGYAKIESFGAFVAAVVIVILGAFIIYHAYERILNPTEIINPEITMITLVAAGSITLHRAFRVRRVAKKYNLISLNLGAKNSQRWQCFVCGVWQRSGWLLLWDSLHE